MARYILGRIAGLLLVILAVSVVTFFLMHAVPGGPFVFEKQPLPPFAMDNINRVLNGQHVLAKGQKRPLVFAARANHHGRAVGLFGTVDRNPDLGFLELAVAEWSPFVPESNSFGLGTLAGVVAAIKQNSWIDRAITLTATLGLTLPNFIVAFLLVFLFSVHLHWLPTGGWGSPKQLIMPVIAYSLGPLAIIARYTRASMLEVLRSEYVRLARARGLSQRRVLMRYVLRTALIPLITVLGPTIPDILTGSIFIESAFALPGIGRFFTSSALTRDYPMIMAMMLLVACLWGVTYLVSDLLYLVADPRVRLGQGRAA